MQEKPEEKDPTAICPHCLFPFVPRVQLMDTVGENGVLYSVLVTSCDQCFSVISCHPSPKN
jgi:RNase P subunit RPR2